jgi:hypothetical protein
MANTSEHLVLEQLVDHLQDGRDEGDDLVQIVCFSR